MSWSITYIYQLQTCQQLYHMICKVFITTPEKYISVHILVCKVLVQKFS